METVLEVVGLRQPSSNQSADPPPRQSHRDRTESTTSRRVSGKGDTDSSSSGSRDTDRLRRTTRRGQRRRKKHRDSDSSSDRDKSNESKRDDFSKVAAVADTKTIRLIVKTRTTNRDTVAAGTSAMDVAVQVRMIRRRLHVAVRRRTTRSIGSNRKSLMDIRRLKVS